MGEHPEISIPASAGTNQVLRYWLGLDVDRKVCDEAHRAYPDALVTAHLLVKLLEHASINDMMLWTALPPRYPTCPIGAKQGWAGRPWHEIEYSFLSWVLGNVDDQDIVWNARIELDRRAKEQEAARNAEKRKARENTIERQAYINAALQAVEFGTSYADMLSWFKNEEPNRAKWGIVKGDDDYRKILDACKSRKIELERIDLY